ncbi:YopX family protein [Bacillus velezensis]|uniref:YopX family protein n=1 Tax=Bacillus velezensis TaxID=492670 RepID=UPI001C00A5EF|nr:YopX family protein [Bacillus velezensis]QWK23498.1 YopX family protein [Bacillus velezensis]
MNTAYRVWDGEEMYYYGGEGLQLVIENNGGWELRRQVHGNIFAWIADSTNENAALMWGTGLKDKNGKIIYEHDIASKGERVNEIIRSGGKFLLKINGCWGMELDSSFEVIGDVYRNPELLEDAE